MDHDPRPEPAERDVPPAPQPGLPDRPVPDIEVEPEPDAENLIPVKHEPGTL